MISGLDPSTDRFLRELNWISDRARTAQHRLTSGKKVERASDSPDGVTHLLTVRADLARTEQITFNLNRVKTETDTAEQTLGNAIKLVERAIVLAAQGANTTTSTASRATAGAEVAGILEQLVNMSQVRVENRYVFAGDLDQQIPYTYDATQPYPVTAYAGAASTRKAEHPSGFLFSTSRTAQEIFDSPVAGQSVFHAVDNLRTALQNDSQPGVVAAISELHTAGTHLNQQLAFYGFVQNRVTEATDFANRKQVLLKAQLADIEDADPYREATELQQASTQLQAAMASHAQLPRSSLFDYLG
jgi:flagellar hook-associated protein 3 FlgL